MAPNLRSQAATGEVYSAVLQDAEGQEGRPPEPLLWGCSTSLAIRAQVDHSVLSFRPTSTRCFRQNLFFIFLKMISSTAANPSQHLELLQENSSGLRDQKFLFPKFKMKTELQVAPGQTQVGDRGC